MKITIETIPHSVQRYDTCGDWQWNDDMDELTIYVSELRDYFAYEGILLIGVHELVEALLCRRRMISEQDVDAFDTQHAQCANPVFEEPGDDPSAPYHEQHVFASNIERLIAAYMHLNWQQYEAAIKRLG